MERWCLLRYKGLGFRVYDPVLWVYTVFPWYGILRVLCRVWGSGIDLFDAAFPRLGEEDGRRHAHRGIAVAIKINGTSRTRFPIQGSVIT